MKCHLVVFIMLPRKLRTFSGILEANLNYDYFISLSDNEFYSKDYCMCRSHDIIRAAMVTQVSHLNICKLGSANNVNTMLVCLI